MECKNCGTLVDDSFTFCPHCGKKIKRKERLLLRNTDWLRLASKEDIESFYPIMASMTVDQFCVWRDAMHENIRIFQIRVFYKHSVLSRRFSIYGESVDETIERIDSCLAEGNSIDCIEVRECNLSTGFSLKDCGVNWFRTYAECNAAINKVKKHLEEKMKIINEEKEKMLQIGREKLSRQKKQEKILRELQDPDGNIFLSNESYKQLKKTASGN